MLQIKYDQNMIYFHRNNLKEKTFPNLIGLSLVKNSRLSENMSCQQLKNDRFDPNGYFLVKLMFSTELL